MRSLGLSYAFFENEIGVMMPVMKMDIEFLRPAFTIRNLRLTTIPELPGREILHLKYLMRKKSSTISIVVFCGQINQKRVDAPPILLESSRILCFRWERLKAFFEEFLKTQTIFIMNLLGGQKRTLPGLGSEYLPCVYRANSTPPKGQYPQGKCHYFQLYGCCFPFTIFLLTLLPYFHIGNAIDLLRSSVGSLMPSTVEITVCLTSLRTP